MPRRGANLEARLDRLAHAIRDRMPSGMFDVVQAVPIDGANGMAPGLYPHGPPGSTAGVLIYDPALGEPQLPPGRMSPWGLLIVGEGSTHDTII